MEDDTRILTCAYCGKEYPADTKPSQDDALYAHIHECEKHPLKAMADENAKLRETLEYVEDAIRNMKVMMVASSYQKLSEQIDDVIVKMVTS